MGILIARTQNRATTPCHPSIANRHRLIAGPARRLRGESGQSLVEFAIVLPVLMLILMGILWFGRFLNYSSQETRMASEAARWASVNTNPGTTIQAYVKAQAAGELGAGSTDVPTPVNVYLYYPSGQTSPGTVGTAVRACVTATVHYLPIIGGANTQIVQTATMRLEQTPTVWTTDTPPAGCPLS